MRTGVTPRHRDRITRRRKRAPVWRLEAALGLVDDLAGFTGEVAHGVLCEFQHVAGRGAALVTPALRADEHQADGGARADARGGGGRQPRARVAHRGQLPALELLDGGERDAAEAVLEALLEVGRRLDRLQRLPQQLLDVQRALAHDVRPPASARSWALRTS